MSTALHRAAARYCAAKDRERVLVRSMRRCERVAYLIGHDDIGNPERTTPAEPANDGGVYCSRAMIVTTGWGGYPEDAPLPPDRWCAACRANIPAVEELRRVRRSLGGLAMVMRCAARKAAAEVAS